jgi:hypothetical protein
MHTFLTSIAAKIKNGPLIATSYEFIFSLKQQHHIAGNKLYGNQGSLRVI